MVERFVQYARTTVQQKKKLKGGLSFNVARFFQKCQLVRGRHKFQCMVKITSLWSFHFTNVRLDLYSETSRAVLPNLAWLGPAIKNQNKFHVQPCNFNGFLLILSIKCWW